MSVVGGAVMPLNFSKAVRRTAANGAGGGSLLTMPGLTAFNATHEAERRQQLEVGAAYALSDYYRVMGCWRHRCVGVAPRTTYYCR